MPYATNDGFKVYYETEGESKAPPLMMVHGFAGNLEHWRSMGFVKELSQDYRLILVDARGHGKSEKPHDLKSYDLKLMVEDLVTVLDDLEIRNANYYGYSLGGRIGFRIPLYAPTRFQSLILGGATYPVRGDEDEKDDTLLSIQETLEAALKESPDRAMEIYIAMREKRFGAFPAAIRDSYLQNDPLALMAANLAHRKVISPKASAVLSKVNLPTLIFCGDADPRLTGAKECARLIPKAQFVPFPELNHLGAYTRADLIVPHIKRFLAEVNKK